MTRIADKWFLHFVYDLESAENLTALLQNHAYRAENDAVAALLFRRHTFKPNEGYIEQDLIVEKFDDGLYAIFDTFDDNTEMTEFIAETADEALEWLASRHEKFT